MTRWEPLQPSPVAVNALAAQEAAMEYFRFHLGLFNCICVHCNETTAHPPISASRNAFKSLHFKGKEKQFCFPELTVSTTTFNGTSCVQIFLSCLETLCTTSDEPSLGMYQQKHQQQQQNVKNWFGFGSKVNGSQKEISGAFLRQGLCGSDKEMEESRSLQL